MPLNLPKLATLNPSMAYSVGKTLMSVIAWQPAAQSTFQFYEEIDAWLGPWGVAGYPIGYGKKYNIAFNTDPVLNSPCFPTAQRWVRQTTINLQLALADIIVGAIRNNMLYKLAEPQLRRAAFDSHPGAYLRGGLQQVAEEEPECIPVIVMIPWEQFNPLNPNFGATFRQIVEVIRVPGVKSWLRSAMTGGGNLPREGVRVLYEVASQKVDEEVEAARQAVDAARRRLLNEAQKALLRRFADVVDRYYPMPRFL